MAYEYSEDVKFFDKKKISGVGRGEQRKIYDQRRRDILPQHGINLFEFYYSEFGTQIKNMARNREDDYKVIKRKIENKIKYRG